MSEPIDLFRVVMENTHCPTVMEIGAAEGEDTKRYLEVLMSLKRPFRYLAFEPDTRNVWRLRNHPLKDHFEFMAYALGEENKIVRFTPSNHPYSGSIRRPKDHLVHWPFVVFGDPYDVQVMRLDDIIFGPEVKVFDWIWCDAQGCEDMIIRGGQKTFERTRYLFSEYNMFESYEGQSIGPDGQLRLLPGAWDVAQDFRQWEGGGDVLFKNRVFP